METRPFKPYIVVIVLMLLTSIALAVTVDVRVTDEAGIRVELPDKVGDWTGKEIRFCLNAECQQTFTTDLLEDREVCPACGGELSSMSLSEYSLLPKDTIILKKSYTNPSGDTVHVSIVMSGKERASIHRPQVCLVGQGREIVKSEVVPVPLGKRDPLEVMVLDMIQKGRMPDGREVQVGQYYAYWFVGKGRETPYHIQRMIWMAMDRIFKNVSHRWAYISIAGHRDMDSEEHRKQVQEFVHDLYPHMLTPEA